MSVNFDRRRFLKWGAAAGACGATVACSSSMGGFTTKNVAGISGLLAQEPPAFSSFMDVYRKQWSWDKVVRGTHLTNCAFQAHCSFDVYVKDGVVLREEQAGEYPQTNDYVPDFNPRGCQKGSCFSDRMYDKGRVRYPLKRMGERGEGKWKRVTWEEALDDIADTYLDVTVEEGTDRTLWGMGPGIDLGSSFGGVMRFSKLTRSPILECNSEIGDGMRGSAETLGKLVYGRSCDDYFYSDIILFWGGNPAYTQIPNMHFWTEARYNGSKLISICPDYNATATKADQWLPIKIGTDAALGLSACQVMIEEDLIDHAFIKEQTDLPLLVRSDTKAFLLNRDLTGEHSEKERFVCFDSKTNKPAVVPYRTLKLGDLDPELEITTQVTLADGTQVEVETVFSLLKKRIAKYHPDKASKICGINADIIRQFAREIAAAKSVANVVTTALSRFYHGNLMERSIILTLTLAGHMGKKGSGHTSFAFLTNDGLDAFSIINTLEEQPMVQEMLKPVIEQKLAEGDTMEMIVMELARQGYQPGSGMPQFTSGATFWYVHGQLVNLSDAKADPFIKRSYKSHLDEAIDKNWQSLMPAQGNPPRIMFDYISNPLRRLRGSQEIYKNIWPKLKMHVSFDWRMNTTGMHADYVLPISAWYERSAHKWVTTMSPFHAVTNECVPPLGESMSDWDAIALLTKHIQKRARERGITTVESPYYEEVELDKLYDNFTFQGAIKEGETDKASGFIHDTSTTFEGTSWEQAKEKGFCRYTSTGNNYMSVTNATEIKPDETISPLEFHVKDKQPYPTGTRRIQFYLDHPMYHELDEVLPRHKEPILSGGDYPLIMTGGHCRHSIHSTWRDNDLMLRLERGEPTIIMSLSDAAERSIADGDHVRVHNDTGDFECMAVVSGSCRPGQTIMYHAWEDYQFKGEGTMRHVTGSPLNPIGLAGGGLGGGSQHIEENFCTFQPDFTDRETRVDITNITSRVNLS